MQIGFFTEIGDICQTDLESSNKKVHKAKNDRPSHTSKANQRPQEDQDLQPNKNDSKNKPCYPRVRKASTSL